MRFNVPGTKPEDVGTVETLLVVIVLPTVAVTFMYEVIVLFMVLV